jgi:hypothetical protein
MDATPDRGIFNETGEVVNAETGARFFNRLVERVGIELRLDKSGKLTVSTPTGSLGKEYHVTQTISELYWNNPNAQRSSRDPTFARVVYGGLIYPMDKVVRGR